MNPVTVSLTMYPLDYNTIILLLLLILYLELLLLPLTTITTTITTTIATTITTTATTHYYYLYYYYYAATTISIVDGRHKSLFGLSVHYDVPHLEVSLSDTHKDNFFLKV